jgi:hypothetical protein
LCSERFTEVEKRGFLRKKILSFFIGEKMETIAFTYEECTINFIYRSMDTIKKHRLLSKIEYLFLNKEAEEKIHNQIKQLFRSEMKTEDSIALFLGMHVCILPTVPNNIALFGMIKQKNNMLLFLDAGEK